jgi:hypothetical protein
MMQSELLYSFLDADASMILPMVGKDHAIQILKKQASVSMLQTQAGGQPETCSYCGVILDVVSISGQA